MTVLDFVERRVANTRRFREEFALYCLFAVAAIAVLATPVLAVGVAAWLLRDVPPPTIFAILGAGAGGTVGTALLRQFRRR